MILPNLKNKNIELSSEKKLERNIVTTAIKSVASVSESEEVACLTSDYSELSEKPCKKKKKHSKHSEHKKHKQKHVCKNKRKLADVSVFSQNEPLDVSDADVQRKLMAMPSLNIHKSSNMKDMSVGQNKVNLLPGNIISVGNEVSMTTVKDKAVINITNVGQVSNSSYSAEKEVQSSADKFTESYVKVIHVGTMVKPSTSLIRESELLKSSSSAQQVASCITQNKQVRDSDGFVTWQAKEDTTLIGIPQPQLTKPFNFSIYKGSNTMLTAKPMASYVKNDIIKAPRLSVFTEELEPQSIQAKQLNLQESESLTEEDKDISNAVDGLLVLQQKSWKTIQEPKLGTNSNIMLVPNSTFAARSQDSNVTMITQNQKSNVTHWKEKLNQLNSINTCVNQLRTTEAADPAKTSCNFLHSSKSPLNRQYDCSIERLPNSRPKGLEKSKLFTNTRKSQTKRFWQIPNGNKVFFSNDNSVEYNESSAMVSHKETDIQISTDAVSISPSILNVSDTKPLCIASNSYPIKYSLTSQPKSDPFDSRQLCKSTEVLPTLNLPSSLLKIVPRTLEHGHVKTFVTSKRQPCKKFSVNFTEVKSHDNSFCEDDKKFDESETCSSISTQIDNLSRVGMNQCDTDIDLNVGIDNNVRSSLNAPSTEVQNQPKSFITLVPGFNKRSVTTGKTPQTPKLQDESVNEYSSAPRLKATKSSVSAKRKPKEKLKKSTVRGKRSLESKPPILEDQSSSSTHVQVPSSNAHSVIPGHILEMLYPNALDINLLQAFNDYWSAQVSHCAVCATFASARNGGGRQMPSDWKYCKPTVLPENSPIWVSSTLFAANSKEQGTEPENDKLLSCRKCHVTVHASCYGVTVLPTDLQNWACDKCRAGMIQVMCCLCPMRGGAVKRTSDGRWAHIVCALLLPGVTFKDPINKDPINVLTIKTDMLKQQCCCCGQKDGACLSCRQCNALFHPSCGLVAGATFDIPAYNLQELQVMCHGHDNGKEKIPMIRQSETVWAKHRNTRYYKAKVDSINDTLFYMVAFNDNSFSDDLYPSDICNYDSGNPPMIGAAVTVNWTDGQVYDGTFEGTNHRIMYTVIFEDGSQLVLKRSEIYSLQEEMPKRVRSRLQNGN